MNRRVRVRFAPSPTGPLHMGGVRTAMFNYLFAKQNGGDFLLRIEDTDQKRFVPGAEDYIMEALAWCGMSFDEGIREGGKFGPYRQSERKDIYIKYAQQLLDTKQAYYAFDTPEALEDMRTRLENEKSSVRQYNAVTRSGMKNSYTMSDDEVKQQIASGEPYVIRFAMPENENVTMNDLIRGEIIVNTQELDDKVLFKSSDGLPTYHLANIVDDHLMEISHVIRGEEWLPSLPLHVLLYRAFGWTETMPQFAHLPLLLKPDGKGKLSKRDGDRLGFPVFPLAWKDPETGEFSSGYRESGYLPEAFVNMLALLGWNPGTEQEIFSMSELIEAFNMSKISKAGAKFSVDKAKWFNQHYIKNCADSVLADYFKPILAQHQVDVCDDYLLKVVPHVKERVVLIPDFWEQAAFFFQTPMEYNPNSIKKHWKEDTAAMLAGVKSVLESVSEADFSTHNTEERVKQYISDNALNMGKVLNPLRLVLTGTGGGPHLFDIVSVIGKDETLKRIDLGLEKIV